MTARNAIGWSLVCIIATELGMLVYFAFGLVTR
jgi:hypothetical protein